MGLDQFASIRKKDKELHYWRKHYALQEWMEKLWKSRGGTGNFNCKDVYLYEEDLNKLEADIKAEQLPETSGFLYKEQMEDDLEFIKKARKALKEDKDVVYSSWW